MYVCLVWLCSTRLSAKRIALSLSHGLLCEPCVWCCDMTAHLGNAWSGHSGLCWLTKVCPCPKHCRTRLSHPHRMHASGGACFLAKRLCHVLTCHVAAPDPYSSSEQGPRAHACLKSCPPMSRVRMSDEEVRDPCVGFRWYMWRSRTRPGRVQTTYVGVQIPSAKARSHGSSPEHFHLEAGGNTGPVLERGVGLETNGPVRWVHTHGLGCSVP
jgi:hypothetical protein